MFRTISHFAPALFLCALLGVLAVSSAEAAAKKGLGNWGSEVRQNQLLNAGWWYNWGLDKKNAIPDAEFVPQAWSYKDNLNNNFVDSLNKSMADTHPKYLLGYNEPDGEGQADMSVEKALEGWPYLMKTGLLLGSPGAVHADDPWMKEFMAGIAKKGYRVDFICIHWYSIAPQELLDYVERIHKLYGKPVWITEFCPVDWDHKGRVTPQSAIDFIKVVLP